MAEFKFQLGQLVMLRAGIEESMLSAKAIGSEGRMPRVFQVNERLKQECPGGVQTQYRLGGMDRWVLEEELCPTTDFDHEAYSKTFVEKYLKFERAKREEQDRYYAVKDKTAAS